MINIYLYISTVLFLFFSVIWSGSNYFNVFLKMFFVGMFVYGSILSLSNFGILYIP